MGLIGDLLEAKVKEAAFWAGASAVSSIADAAVRASENKSNKVLAAPESAAYCIGKDYQEISEKFRAYGFDDVRVLRVKKKLFKKENRVASVSIGGEDSFDKGDRFKRGLTVTIEYYG